jgi:hypothetical protein
VAQGCADLSRAVLRFEPGNPHRITAPRVTAHHATSRHVVRHPRFRGR